MGGPGSLMGCKAPGLPASGLPVSPNHGAVGREIPPVLSHKAAAIFHGVSEGKRWH
jgi:hypothetical protein